MVLELIYKRDLRATLLQCENLTLEWVYYKFIITFSLHRRNGLALKGGGD